MTVHSHPAPDAHGEEAPWSTRLGKIVQAALPRAQILRVVPFAPDSLRSDETSKGTGYGKPYRVDVIDEEGPRSLVLHTATANQFGHDRRADRAAAAILAADTFGTVPRHVAVVDVGAFRGETDFVSVAGTNEFYLLTSHADGRVYADDLRQIARRGQLSSTDIARSRVLVDYLARLHSHRPDSETAYRRFVRDTLGGGEGIFGIIDGYPEDVPAAPRARLNRIEEACLRFRHLMQHRRDRLRRTHGDFHPFNVVFDERSRLSLLDASRGALGDPGDDLACMAINYAFFSLGHAGAWRGAFAALWRGFWETYLQETGDHAVLEVVAPLLAWRGLVLASPTWYPELAATDRERILSFVERALAAERFAPATANEFFDT